MNKRMIDISETGRRVTLPPRGRAMPVKRWSSAGLILTYWCNASCASCYLCCGPGRTEWMSPADALRYWRELIEAANVVPDPGGAVRPRIHVTGGEPFGDWQRLLEICTRARDEGLLEQSALEKVETNAFWATDAGLVEQRIRALAACGMQKLAISADPYHQQYVPIERCRLAARVAEEVLGSEGVQVRWRDWLAEGMDTDALSDGERNVLFRKHFGGGRERFNGRAATWLAGDRTEAGEDNSAASLKPAAAYADACCSEALRRSRHVHVGPDGNVMPGTCAGIILGNARQRGLAEIWRQLYEAFYTDGTSREQSSAGAYPVVSRLSDGGPVALADAARRDGFGVDSHGYASKCHLCWNVRTFLVDHAYHETEPPPAELGPSWMYKRDR